MLIEIQYFTNKTKLNQTSLILFVKYLIRLKSLFKITRFPLFQNVNKNFFCLKYEQRALSF